MSWSHPHLRRNLTRERGLVSPPSGSHETTNSHNYGVDSARSHLVSLGLMRPGSRRSHLVSHPFRGGTMKPRLRLQPPTQQAEVYTHFRGGYRELPPGGKPYHIWTAPGEGGQVSTYGEDRNAPAGYAILCGIGSHRMAMSYKLGVPGVSPLETHTATLSPVLGSVMTWGNPIILRSNGRLSGGVNSTIDKVRWPDVPIPEECLYSCAMLSNSSAG